MGFRHWASTPPDSRRSRQSATGPPGGYPDRTHTGKRRRADNPRSTICTVNLLSAERTERAHCLLWVGWCGEGGHGAFGQVATVADLPLVVGLDQQGTREPE